MPRHQIFEASCAHSRTGGIAAVGSYDRVVCCAATCVPVPAALGARSGAAGGGQHARADVLAWVEGLVGASHKVAAARKLGADTVIDKSTELLWPAARVARPTAAIFEQRSGLLKNGYEHLALRLPAYGFHSMLPRTGGVDRTTMVARGTDWVLPRFDR